MRNKSKLKIIILVLGIVFALSPINSFKIISDQGENEGTTENRDETNFKRLKSSGYWSTNFIHIDGNWSETATTYDWCSGDGLWGNPYTIENLTIDASDSPTGIGIYINGSKNEYFVIRNCTIYNGSTGIALENTDNGTLTKNTCSNNTNYGISLWNSSNNTISENTANNNTVFGIRLRYYCNNNTISRNTANNNKDSGIFLREICDDNFILENTVNGNNLEGIYLRFGSNNNEIWGNTVSDNNRYGIALVESSNNNLVFYNYIFNNSLSGFDRSNNVWDNGTIGNYWSDYDGVDANDNGIGDTPYLIEGTSGSRDNYPIWDDGPHVIKINSPNPGDIFETISPDFNVSINFPILDASWYTLDNGLTNYTFIGSSGTINQAVWDACENGNVTIRFFVNNTAGNFRSTEIIIIKDTIAPKITISFPIMNSVFGEFSPAYDISIEEANLNKSWYTIDGGLTNFTFTNTLGIIDQDIWTATPNGHVIIRFYANDLSGYEGFRDLIVVKDAPVNLIYIEISDHFYSLEHFNLTFSIFDDTGQGISLATIQMWWNGTDVSSEIQNLGNGLYFVSLAPITVAPGEDPILLKMVISASGYEEKDFETYLAVDPDTLNKGKPAEEFPLALAIIVISSIAGGIGVAVMTILILRRRK